MKRTWNIIIGLLTIIMLAGCYHTPKHTPGSVSVTTDSIASYNAKYVTDSSSLSSNQQFNDIFLATHHYAQNYNFVVKGDSLVLLKQQPEEFLSNMPTDSFAVGKNSHIVVVDMRILRDDNIDSVWVQVASDQYTFGWTHEKSLLVNVVPDDPISQFISTFSDTHLLVSLIIISIIAGSYVIYRIRRKRLKIVHLNDIDSFYPTLLAITVATAATFYSSIQIFAPDKWRHFYFHPSLNPFALPCLLAVFIASVWLLVIMLIATIDDVYHKLPPTQATFYLLGLAAVCAANYIIFSISTLYYIGYALLIAYIIFAVKAYMRSNYYKYVCGNCGAKLHHKGNCPKCGAKNI